MTENNNWTRKEGFNLFYSIFHERFIPFICYWFLFMFRFCFHPHKFSYFTGDKYFPIHLLGCTCPYTFATYTGSTLKAPLWCADLLISCMFLQVWNECVSTWFLPDVPNGMRKFYVSRQAWFSLFQHKLANWKYNKKRALQ